MGKVAGKLMEMEAAAGKTLKGSGGQQLDSQVSQDLHQLPHLHTTCLHSNTCCMHIPCDTLCHLTYWPLPGLRPVGEGVKYIISVAVYIQQQCLSLLFSIYNRSLVGFCGCFTSYIVVS